MARSEPTSSRGSSPPPPGTRGIRRGVGEGALALGLGEGVRVAVRRLLPAKWRRTQVAAFLAVAYLVVMFPVGGGNMLADTMMLFPTRHVLPAPGSQERFVETPVGRMQVLVRRSPGWGDEQPRRFVLWLEGNGGRAEHRVALVADRWADQPTEVWAMNHPGFGQSEGPASLRRLGPAAIGVYDELARVAGDAPVFIDSDSMGTAVALHVAVERQEERPVAGLILKNPPPLRTLVLRRFGWWNLWLGAGPVAAGIPRELDSIGNARRCNPPAIVITATADGLVPPRYQRMIIDAYSGPVTEILFEGGTHNTPLDAWTEQQIRRAIASFGKADLPDEKQVEEARRQVDPTVRGER